MSKEPCGTVAERRAPRAGRLFNASIFCERRGEMPIMVRNISPSGLGARGVSGLERGERITVRLNNELIGAEVCWSHRNQFGVRLDTQVDPSLFTFDHKGWENSHRPLEPGHVFDQFKPVTDFRRPGLRVR